MGFSAQGIFSARFIVQWIASERAVKDIVPIAFWFISLTGGRILLAYVIYRRDPVFIVGQATGIFIYTRNLILIYHEKQHSGGKSVA